MKVILPLLFALLTSSAFAQVSDVSEAQCYIKKSGLNCDSNFNGYRVFAKCSRKVKILSKDGDIKNIRVFGSDSGTASEFANFMTLGLNIIAVKTAITSEAKENLNETLELLDKCTKEDLQFARGR